jgi:hypothetical protein
MLSLLFLSGVFLAEEKEITAINWGFRANKKVAPTITALTLKGFE